MTGRVNPLPTLVALLAPALAHAQGFGAGYELQGIHLDPDGVLSSRSTDPDPELAEIRKKASKQEKEGALAYISLPRLLDRARKHIEAGEPLPDEVRYLGGLVRLQYVFVFPEEGDLVIAGPSEPFDASKNAYRPLGRVTGRPVLHLEDLVAALRAFRPGSSPDRIGCDIVITQEIARRVNDKVKEVEKKILAGMKPAEAARQIAEAGGNQPVKIYGVDPNTRFAFVCVEADYRLKQLGLDLLPSPVRGVKSYFANLTRPEPHHRFSLESHYDAVNSSPDGNAFEFRGPSLKVEGGILHLEGTEKGDASKAAQKFMDACNRNFSSLAEALLSWADLQNLGDLSLLAALIAKEGLAAKARWDPAWALDPKGFPVTEIKAPESAKVVCNHRFSGGMLLLTSGGVGLWAKRWAEKVVKTEDAGLRERARRPEKEVWIPTRSSR